MQESILLIILIIITFVFFFINKNELIYIKSEYNDKEYLVNNDEIKQDRANLLSLISIKLFALKKFLNKNINKYPEYKKYIININKNFLENRTEIIETDLNSSYTSYSVNKGDELYFCLTSKTTNELHDINILMYVALHELAHIACPEIGHTPLFKKIFAFLVNISTELNIYKYINYNINPLEYCGMELNSSIT